MVSFSLPSLRAGSAGLLLALAGLLGCADPEKPTHTPPVAPKARPAAPAPAAADTTEYLDWAAARLNGRLPLQSPREAAWRELGPPDSVVTPDMAEECASFFSQDFQRAYTSTAALELYGDTAVVTSLTLRADQALHVGRLRLDRRTTLAELAKTFPRAVSHQSAVHDEALGDVLVVSLDVAPPPTDDHWQLLFKAGRLVRIDYFVPC